MMKVSISFVLLIVSYLLIASGVVVRYYNEINHKDMYSFEEFSKTYLTYTDTEGVAVTNTNILLGVATAECKELLDIAAFRGAQRNAGGGVVSVVYLPVREFPHAIDGCVEVFYYPVHTPIDDPFFRTVDLEYTKLTQIQAEAMIVGVTFTNNFPYAIYTVYNEESALPTKGGILQPGESTQMNTYLGHIFSANKESDDSVVDFMVVDGREYTLSPLNRLETCEVPLGMVPTYASTIHCDNMDSRLYEFSHQVWHTKRLGLNYVQPQMVEAVTEDGFQLLKLPADTYKWLKEWYDEEKSKETTETSAGPCMNQKVSPSMVSMLPGQHKDRLSEELRSTLEGWYGGELELTSIYGIRKYTNGSILRMHVDTVNTHVVSAIINVDQDLDQEWPLLILDHNDNEHELLMKPGDMVLYESAKLLHGRPSVMKGSHYDNIFIHYKPVSGWDYGWL
mmetsp:Transcript_4231/g.4385  ORF Transcript_4231/g.4385 Transcript_4231/m.4385 type:complete len:450 (+) Transcript_4231:81-1430(+)